MLLAGSIDLSAGERSSAVTAEADDGSGGTYPLTVESVTKVPGHDWLSQVVIRFPDQWMNPKDVWGKHQAAWGTEQQSVCHCEAVNMLSKSSVQTLCSPCLCGGFIRSRLLRHRDRENTERIKIWSQRVPGLLLSFVICFQNLFLASAQVKKVNDSPQGTTHVMSKKENYSKLAAEMEAVLQRDVLGVWFPRSVDRQNGGFYSNYTRGWQRTNSEGKFSVFQGRMVWVASQVMMQRPEMKAEYQAIVEHGLKYLNEVLWDKKYGGFYWGMDDKNEISPAYTDGKHLYGISFGLYGATAAYNATKNQLALTLAQNTFRWIDQHAHDPKNGGYFEWLTREGKVVQRTETATNVPVAGFPIGYKSMNTHIHLLESFTQLYEVWPDDTLRLRLIALLEIVRDKVCVQPGVMNLYFTLDWRPIPDHDSYGHDVETAYLLLEAEAALGRKPSTKTETMAQMLVDHALVYGWDETNGGFYRDGTTFGAAEDKRKEWWVQFEGLNALLLMHEKYGKQSDRYYKAFERQWQFIKDHQIDNEFGGVFDTVEADGSVKDYTKSRIWKECYHESRALFNTIARLKKL